MKFDDNGTVEAGFTKKARGIENWNWCSVETNVGKK